MYWQREQYRTSRSMTLNNTDTLELPKSGALGSIHVKLSGAEATGLGANGGAWRLIDFLTKIEVIGDGATVITSLTGRQLAALGVRDQGIIPPGDWRNYATNTQYQYFILNFGRYLWDRKMFLDLAKFNTVELKITNNATAASFTDFTATIDLVWLREYEAMGAPIGYRRCETWRTWTTVQAETKYNLLPVEYPIKAILLQAVPPIDASNIESTGMINMMTDIHLALKTGQVDVYHGTLEMLIRENAYEIGKPLVSKGYQYVTANHGFDVGLGYVEGGAWGAGDQAGAVATIDPTMESGRSSFTQKPVSYQADHPMGFVFVGWAPFNCAWFGFDDDQDPATWLDPDATKQVTLDIQTRDAASAAGGTNAIVLDRLVRY